MSAPRVWQLLLAAFLLSTLGAPFAKELPAFAKQRLARGEAVDLIVEYRTGGIDEELAAKAGAYPPAARAAALAQLRKERLQSLRGGVDAAVRLREADRLMDYAALPMAFRRFRTLAEAQDYAAHPDVKAFYRNETYHHALVQSLPQVGQTAVAAAYPQAGDGTTIAVIDNGINFGLPVFGACTAPGMPAGCKVVASVNFGTGTSDTSHGTNVSAIMLGVAPGARIAMLNAFSGGSATSAAIIAAIDWAVYHRPVHNIVSINMSLAQINFWYYQPCESSNEFLTPVATARAAGIAVVAATGNMAVKTGLPKPACTPGVVSVGAVYDANLGSVGAGFCSDATTSVDKVACFSNSASYLTLLAPGALITAAGIGMMGTSQASPHVAGAFAVLRSLHPGESLGQLETRLTSSGTPITDTANGVVTPRLALLPAARPANDPFAAAAALAGTAGSVGASNLLASKEAGEANHAGNSGGRSLWWRWTAASAGQMQVDTHGSSFDTLLAVYAGNGLSALTPVAANDNDPEGVGGSSRVLFQAVAGREYRIAVDGFAAAAGAATLNWYLNPAAQANLSIAVHAAPSGSDTAGYDIVVGNAGPQEATGVSARIDLPDNAVFLSASPQCALNGAQVQCALGSLASGAQVSLTLQLRWLPGVSQTIAASVASDLPDPQGGDNTLTVAVSWGEGENADVPVLPLWALAMTVMLFGGLIARHRRNTVKP